jgi:hypothetical protein
MILCASRVRCAVVMMMVPAVLLGCGGGGGARPALSKSALAKQRMAAAARVSRSVLAVTGLGRNITRAGAAHTFFGTRIPLFFGAATRAARTGTGTGAAPAPAPALLDPGSGLYYVTTLNADGSGSQLLYLDAAATQPAGWFRWVTPRFTTTNPPTYPAQITVVYKITAGSFAGVSGTMRLTVNDPNFGTGVIELALTDTLHESAQANFNLSAEGIQGKQDVDLGNGDSCSVTDTLDQALIWTDVFTFPEGVTIDMSTDPDGTSTETYSDPSPSTDNPIDATGNISSDGTDTIDYSDGGSDTVNVDPGSYDDIGSDSSGDSPSSDSGFKKVKKAVRTVPGKRPGL